MSDQPAQLHAHPPHDAPRKDPLLGRVLADRYRIVSPLGSGGMGQVYLAQQAPLNREVAIKVLAGAALRDPSFERRFMLEAAVTSRLSHPNTVTLIDYGKSEGVLFIAMELLRGRTLSTALREDGAFPQLRALHIAQQVCRSLREAHAQGIVHRDLKPANVMLLDQQDEHDFVKVLDFGLVKSFADTNEPAAREMSHGGIFMGTPQYMAPEQARNQKVDQRADIYALGVLLYLMLTGRVPFNADNAVDILLMHLQQAPPPMAQVLPGLSLQPGLEELVLRCLAKSPDDRPQSMVALLDELRALRAAITGDTSPRSFFPPAAGAYPTNPVSGQPSVGHATPVSQPGFSPSMPPPAPREALADQGPATPSPSAPARYRTPSAGTVSTALKPQAEAPAAKSRRGLWIGVAASAAVAALVVAFAVRQQRAAGRVQATATAQAPAPPSFASGSGPGATLPQLPVQTASAGAVAEPPHATEPRATETMSPLHLNAAPAPAESALDRAGTDKGATASREPARSGRAEAAKRGLLDRLTKRAGELVSRSGKPAAAAPSTPPPAPAASVEKPAVLLASATAAAPAPASAVQTSAAPESARKPPRNVPAAYLQRELVSQPPIRVSQIFRDTSRGRGVMTGMYRICVAEDGTVQSVSVVRSIPNGDHDVLESLKGAVYMRQSSPVCALVSVPVDAG